MKTMKINLALAALLICGTIAFAFNAPVKHSTSSYWEYVSGPVTAESSYTAVMSPSCPTGTANICAILAPADPTNPNEPQIDSQLASRITNKDTSDGDVFLKH